MVRVLLVSLIALCPALSAQAGGFDCSRFQRNDDGSWRVLEALQIRGPHGRIDYTPDETYREGSEKMGLDIAKLLNANCVKKQ
jgi:hypothetical protein